MNEYIDELICESFALQKFIRESEKVRNDICPSIGKEAGQLLYFLTKLTKAKNIMEIGTSIGYSTIWLAYAIKDFNGKIDTIEASERLSNEAKLNINALDLGEYVDFHVGFGEEIINTLKKTYDLIFIDSSTKSYKVLYEKSINKLKTGGLIIFEDVLFPSIEKRQIQKVMMDELNKMILEDNRVEKCFLNIGDGLLICLKK